MNVTLPGSYEGHHFAAGRLADAIGEALRDGAQATAPLSDDALDATVGGTESDVYWASAVFLADWRSDAHRPD